MNCISLVIPFMAAFSFIYLYFLLKNPDKEWNDFISSFKIQFNCIAEFFPRIMDSNFVLLCNSDDHYTAKLLGTECCSETVPWCALRPLIRVCAAIKCVLCFGCPGSYGGGSMGFGHPPSPATVCLCEWWQDPAHLGSVSQPLHARCAQTQKR